MATNKRDLKAYARFDGTGRIVPGSLVLRRAKPKVGRWKEVEAYECCTTPTLNSGEIDFESFPWEPAAFVVYCNSTNQYIYVNTDVDVTNIVELVAALNATGSNIGTFSIGADGVSVNITISPETMEVFKDCWNDLGFETFEN